MQLDSCLKIGSKFMKNIYAFHVILISMILIFKFSCLKCVISFIKNNKNIFFMRKVIYGAFFLINRNLRRSESENYGLFCKENVPFDL